MDDEFEIISKILIHDEDESARSALKGFCQTNSLVGMVDHAENVMDILKSSIDLGAVLISENGNGIALAMEMHHARPELPIFLRREGREDLEDLSQEQRFAFAGAYSVSNLTKLKNMIDEYLFCRFYPANLVRGIQELALESLRHTIKGATVTAEVPFLVKDQIIYGELFSLIPLEGDWCRGYMMLQTTERELMDLVVSGMTSMESAELDFRIVNGLLNEITNMIWGGIKARFFGSTGENDAAKRTQVPIMVNHDKKYIWFGSTEPQLCFKFKVSDPSLKASPVTIYQKVVFNLSWSPEQFEEAQQAMDELVDSGELELF